MTDIEQAAQTELHLAHDTGDAGLMARAAEHLGGMAVVLFDGSGGDREQIEAGVSAYLAEAERLAALANRSVHLEMPNAPVPEVWADSARRVLEAGGMVVSVTTTGKRDKGITFWNTVRRLRLEDEERLAAGRQD